MDVVTPYLELCLRLGRHVDGLVDAYYGPPEISERVEGEDLRPPPALVEDAASLLEAADGNRWLRAQLVGLETVARKLAGEEIAYEDEVERCYGVRPAWTPEESFEDAHRQLDEVLTGSGMLAERYQAWREGDGYKGEELAAIFDQVTEDFRMRTEAMFGLPEGESVAVDYVADESWAAFNYYKGDLQSRIAVNTDVALTPDLLVHLVAHETYPGHHTEHAWKEQLHVREGLRLEKSALMVGTPSSLISEGIAELGKEVMLGDEVEDVVAAHVAEMRPGYDPDVARTVKKARRPLERVAGNVALLIHTRGISTDEAVEYTMRWALSSRQRAERSVRFITDPVWRSYVTTYTDGYELCRRFVDGDQGRFKRLLTEQLTPADLR